MFRLAALAFCLAAALAQAQPPKSADPRLIVEPFAVAPDIVHPIALDFDSKGRLLVVESHTHFRPAKYAGPKHDRIRVLEDTNGDGKADRFTTFFEGTTATMDLAVHFDGSVYVATRNEILRLRDTNADGVADEKTRLLFLDTKGDYPHNGLSGLAFDFRGDLVFGLGENLGVAFKLIGSDGITLTGGGEGGGVFRCTADGKKLRRMATGFWNPFGATFDIHGRLYVVDNDPDSSPPCRLLHVVEGGDYGYQFRYGRSGRHPFQSWNGELPGTLPMVAGTGESPCEVIAYESDGLPDEYRGDLLIPVWADHRVERYRLSKDGKKAERLPFIQGSKEFRPSGMTVAPDGSLFVSDWVSQSYELHGKGAVWQVRWKEAKPTARPADRKLALESPHRPTREAAARDFAQEASGRDYLQSKLTTPNDRLRATIETALREAGVSKRAVNEKRILTFGETDPYKRHELIRMLIDDPEALALFDGVKLSDPTQRTDMLLIHKGTGKPADPKLVASFLADPDPTIRLLAAKWIADEKLSALRPQVVEAMKSPTLDPRGFIGLATALARIDDQPVSDDALANYFVERLRDRSSPASARLMAMKVVPASHKNLKPELLGELLKSDDPAVRIEALRMVAERNESKLDTDVAALARDGKQPSAVRSQAVVATSDANLLLDLTNDTDTQVRREALRGLTNTKLSDDQHSRLPKRADPDLLARLARKPFHTNRPPADDTAAWMKLLDGPAYPEQGRRIFESPRLANCSRCHRYDGRGATVGPDLSLIGRTDRKWIVESILKPSAVVAPHFQAWKVETPDGKSRTGLLVRTYLDESYYLDEKGETFKIVAGDGSEVTASPKSVMPDNLFDLLTDQECRDLVALLAGRK